MSMMEKIEAPAHGPHEPVGFGSEAHLRLLCRTLLDTYAPYRPALTDWPPLDVEARARIISLPIWDVAMATEGRAGINVRTYGEGVGDPLLKAVIDVNAFEESRHRIVLADRMQAHGIELAAEPACRRPKDPKFAFLRIGYSECIDNVFGFGLFRLARESGFLPPRPVDPFEPVMRWRRPWFEAKVAAVGITLLRERIDIAKSMGENRRTQEDNCTLHGSEELDVEVSFPKLARTCGGENDRRPAPYDARLIRPRVAPAVLKLAQHMMKGPKTK